MTMYDNRTVPAGLTRMTPSDAIVKTMVVKDSSCRHEMIVCKHNSSISLY